jgi:hypothetical protein
VAAVCRDHAERLAAFFGEEHGMRQMRKWVGWYTKGFRGSARVRGQLDRLRTPADLSALLAQLEGDEPFPAGALRAGRAKGGRTQTVSLPPGYLDDRDSDVPPRGPHTPAELEAWERALQGG